MKKKFSLLYKILILIMSFIGLCLNFTIAPIKNNIIYFTIQSNLLCFLFYLVIVILELLGKLKKNKMYYIIYYNRKRYCYNSCPYIACWQYIFTKS